MSSTNRWQLWTVYHHHHPGSYSSAAALHRTPSSLTAPSDSWGCLRVASGPGSLHFLVSASIWAWVQIIIPSLLMLDWGASVCCHPQNFLWKDRWISSPDSCFSVSMMPLWVIGAWSMQGARSANPDETYHQVMTECIVRVRSWTPASLSETL